MFPSFLIQIQSLIKTNIVIFILHKYNYKLFIFERYFAEKVVILIGGCLTVRN